MCLKGMVDQMKVQEVQVEELQVEEVHLLLHLEVADVHHHLRLILVLFQHHTVHFLDYHTIGSLYRTKNQEHSLK